MNSVAALSAIERDELFQETANRRGLAIDIVEKDFWVCWTLKHLFQLQELGPHLIFKGGTSLSKIFGAIERFSEDIDVSIDRTYLGFGGDADPENMSGSKSRERQLEKLNRACGDRIETHLLPSLEESFNTVLIRRVEKPDAATGRSARTRIVKLSFLPIQETRRESRRGGLIIYDP
jgi:hypothetical protein